MFLITRYRGSFTSPPLQAGSQGDDQCARNCERICWIGFIVFFLGVSFLAFATIDETVPKVTIGSIFLFVGMFLIFSFWMRTVYRASVKRRTQMAHRRDRRAKSEAIIQMSTNRQADPSEENPEEVPETMPLDNPPAYASLNT